MTFAFFLCVILSSGVVASAHSETLSGALSRAYRDNPDLNQQRAAVRVRDEDVPKASTGMRPKASVSLNGPGAQSTNVHSVAGIDPKTGAHVFGNQAYFGQPRGAILSASQPIFDGFRTQNSMGQAESGVFAARADLRFAEQEVLLKSVTAYMDVLRDAAVMRLRANNIKVLKEQLRETRVRLDAQDATFTDLAQAEASLAQAHSDYYLAEANLKVSSANYEAVIGMEPGKLEPAPAIEKLLPTTPQEALQVALIENPHIDAALHQADAAAHGVKVAEGALMPTLSATAQMSQQYDYLLGQPGTRLFIAQAGLQLNVPLYQGGGEYASIRQAKEQLGQARLVADVQRVQARNGVLASYARLKAAKAAIRSGNEVVRAAEVALRGVRLEAAVGQRTVLDVLNAQQSLLEARVKLIGYQHDCVVASYTALAAIGRLDVDLLNIDVERYNASLHYEQVKNSWIGWATPEGQ